MSLTLTEARARAGLISAISYDIELDLSAAATDRGGRFGCRTTVRFDASGAETFLELRRASDLRLWVNGTEVPNPRYEGGRIGLTGLAATNEVVVEARLPYVTDGDGMHTFTDPADGERYVSAYCGVDIAQRVFPCFDQPDLKGTISLQVLADPAWTIIANGRQMASADGVRRFATTPPVPPYLFVVCAGPWASFTWTHRGLPFGWHARQSLATELARDSAELKATTEACFDHYCEMFDEPYAFDSYDQAFVPGLNWGAMEMPGCITYRDELLPPGRISDHDRLWRGTIIAHEMAHMWFGDLVTMRWWEDTWLSESFADYMGFQVGEQAAGFSGALVSFEAQRKPGGYDADQRRSSHPVAALTEEVVDVDTAFGNFDAISYAKGNAVVRQLVTWLGEPDFLTGVNTYLARHRLGNATLADFMAALSAGSDRDVPGWVESWLRTTGFDTIRVTRDGDVPVLIREGSRPHRLSVTAYDGTLAEVDATMVDLADEAVRLDHWAGLVVVPNSRGETFARIRLDAESWAVVAARLSDLRDPLARAVLWSAAFDLARCGELPAGGFLSLVAGQLAQESDVAIVEAVVNRTLTQIVPRQVPASQAAGALDVLSAACTAGLTHRLSEQLALALTRGLARSSRDHALMRSWLSDGRTTDAVHLDPELRWQVVRRLAETGGADEALIEAEALRDTSVGGELGAATARAALPAGAAKDRAWLAMMQDEQVSNRMFEALSEGLWSPEHTALLAPYVARYLTEAPAVAERRGQAFSQVVGQAFPSLYLDDEQVALLAEALAGDVPTVLRRRWEDRYDDVTRARSDPGGAHLTTA